MRQGLRCGGGGPFRFLASVLLRHGSQRYEVPIEPQSVLAPLDRVGRGKITPIEDHKPPLDRLRLNGPFRFHLTGRFGELSRRVRPRRRRPPWWTVFRKGRIDSQVRFRVVGLTPYPLSRPHQGEYGHATRSSGEIDSVGHPQLRSPPIPHRHGSAAGSTAFCAVYSAEPIMRARPLSSTSSVRAEARLPGKPSMHLTRSVKASTIANRSTSPGIALPWKVHRCGLGPIADERFTSEPYQIRGQRRCHRATPLGPGGFARPDERTSFGRPVAAGLVADRA